VGSLLSLQPLELLALERQSSLQLVLVVPFELLAWLLAELLALPRWFVSQLLFL